MSGGQGLGGCLGDPEEQGDRLGVPIGSRQASRGTMGSAATFDYIYLLLLFVIQRVQGMFMGDWRSRGHPGLWGTFRGFHWPAGNVGPLTNYKAHMHKYMIYKFF